MNSLRRLTLIYVVVLLCSSFANAADKMKAEELIAKHLDSLGPAPAQQATERGLRGTAMTHFIVGGAGELTGDAQILSRGADLRVQMRFNQADYPGEDFLCKSNKVNIALIRPGLRSMLGQFLYSHPEVLREGLFGGTLSTAWPLLSPNLREAKVSSDGLKNVDGRKLLQLKYSPRHSGGDDEILLFFDPETYRHVMTRYTSVVRNYGSGDIGRPSGSNIPLVVEERFTDFADTNGLTLPRSWNIKYIQQSGNIEEWRISLKAATNSLDENSFDLANPAK